MMLKRKKTKSNRYTRTSVYYNSFYFLLWLYLYQFSFSNIFITYNEHSRITNSWVTQDAQSCNIICHLKLFILCGKEMWSMLTVFNFDFVILVYKIKNKISRLKTAKEKFELKVKIFKVKNKSRNHILKYRKGKGKN